MPSERDRGALDFRTATAEILRYLNEQIPMAAWIVARRSGSDQVVLAVGGDEVGLTPGHRLPWDRSLSASLCAGGPTLAADVFKVSAYANATAGPGRVVRSFVGAPMVDDLGRIIGTIIGVDHQPRPSWTNDVASLVELHAGLLGAVLSGELRGEDERRRAERVELGGLVDPLTGAADRQSWDALIAVEEQRCLRYGGSASVMVVDLDDLKQVNLTYGRAAGDEALRLTQSVLRNCLRDRDVVARIGGDQFGVIVVDCDQAEAEVLVERIGGELIECGISAAIGVSGRSSGSPTLVDAWGGAGRSMLLARRSHRSARISRLAPPVVRLGDRQIIQIEPVDQPVQVVTPESLLGALENSQFRLHLQPVVDLHDGQISGAEALLRWEHPTRGLLSPADFLAVAEGAGVIRPMGEWVIDEACRLGRRCADEGHDVSFSISANVSVRQLDDASFADRVVSTLERVGLAPHRLHIEVTETMPLNDSRAVDHNLGVLREAGVLVALDDFGTRYATLETLLRCQLDVVKIDQVFVQQVDTAPFARKLVDAVVSLCADSGLGVVAEGVETEAQANVLRDLGCPQAQGFHFGRPVPADDFLVASLV
jgi:diguanylate cyclase (GGDEF)-like protein